MAQNKTIVKVAELLQFIKERLKNDLSEAKIKGMINVDKAELEKIINMSILSIENNFTKSADTILK